MLLETSNLSYLLFEHKKAKTVSGKKTLIFFHGGESSNEVIRPIAPFFENVRLVLPQDPINVKDNLYQWYNFIDGPFSVEKNSLETSMKLAFRLIDDIHIKYPNEKIYVGGISQGAVFSNELFLERPDCFEGMICMSGFLVNQKNHQLLSGKNVFVAHGESDPVVSVEKATHVAETLQEAGAQVKFKTYDMGHALNEDELHDIAKWLD